MPLHDGRGSFNKLHRPRNLAARFSPTFPGESVLSTSTSTTPGGQKSSTAISSAPSPPTTSSTSSTSVSQQQTTSSTSITSSSSTTSTSTTSSTTTTTSTSSSSATSTLSTSSSVVLQTSLYTPSTPVVTVHSTYINTGVSLGSSSTTSATPSSTSNSSGSINTGAVVGGIAGCLIGLAVLGFLITWCIRRKRKNDEDEWDPAAFKRHSAVLLDDPPQPQPSYNPRPPTMIERHNASPALAAQRTYPQNSYGGYGQQPGYGPGQVVQPHGYASREDPNQLNRQPSNATYLSRQPTTAGYGIPNDPQAHYVDLDRSSVTPFQAAQYADISRQLGGDPNSAVAPRNPVDSARLPSPFDDAAEEEYPPHDAAPPAPSHAHIVASPAASTTESSAVPRGREITNAKRPDTVYTMYDEGDAYDGF